MPPPSLKKLAKEHKISEGRIEKLWSKAKAQGLKHFKLTEKKLEAWPKHDKSTFYAYTMGILKHMLGVKSGKGVSRSLANLASLAVIANSQ